MTAEIIEVNFRTKKRIEKYTIVKTICVVCFNTVIYDSRRENNDPYIELPKKKGECICKSCSVAIKELVDENEWDR